MANVRHGAIRLLAATSVGYGLAIFLAPILSRLYSPLEFGVYTLFGAVACCDAIACLGLDRAIGVASNDRSARYLALGACFSAALVAALNAIVAGAITRFFQGPDWLWWVTAIYILSYGIVQSLTGLAIRTKQFDHMAVSRLTQATTVPLVQVGLGLGPKGAISLVVGQIFGQLGGGGAYLARGARIGVPGFRFAEMRHALSSHIRFPQLWAPATMLNSVNLQLSLLGIYALYGPFTAGLYGFGQRIVGAGVGLVASAVSQACFAHVAALTREQVEVGRLRRQLFSVLRDQAILVVPMVGTLVTAPLWTEPLFGSEWRDSDHFFQLMAAPFAMQLLISPVHVIADALSRPEIHLKRELFRLAATLIAFGLAYIYALGPVGVLVLYAVGVCASYICGLWLILSALPAGRKAIV